VMRSPSTMTVTTRGLAPVPSIRVTFVTAIAFDWPATMVTHAIARDATITSRTNRDATAMRTAAVGFTVLLTRSTERTFSVGIACVGLRTWSRADCGQRHAEATGRAGAFVGANYDEVRAGRIAA
jgi:hypothetical protein